MSLTHNSTLAKSEPVWGSVSKADLPRNAHADMGDADSKSSWRYPHHHIESGKIGGKHDVFVSGNMYLHRGGLKAALQAAGGARSGQKEKSSAVKRHLSHHADVIGMSKKETATLLGISIDALKALSDNNNNDLIEKEKKGGVNLMGKTYEDLETDIKALKVSLSEKDATITTMTTDAETAITNAKSLETEIAKYEESEGDLKNEIDTLKKDAEDNNIFIKAGKQFIEDTKAEIHKMSVQVDGNDYNKALVDKQLVAFGIDLEALNDFKKNLETRRSKLFKTGDIDPDGQKDQKTTNQEEYELGQKIGQGNVISIKKAN